MLVGQLLISILVAIVVAVTAAISGHGLVAVLLIYSASGSLTLMLLAGWTAWRMDEDVDTGGTTTPEPR